MKPEERDLPEIIKVFQTNIKYYPSYGLWKPSVCFTKGQMDYIVEILEQHLAEEQSPTESPKRTTSHIRKKPERESS